MTQGLCGIRVSTTFLPKISPDALLSINLKMRMICWVSCTSTALTRIRPRTRGIIANHCIVNSVSMFMVWSCWKLLIIGIGDGEDRSLLSLYLNTSSQPHVAIPRLLQESASCEFMRRQHPVLLADLST